MLKHRSSGFIALAIGLLMAAVATVATADPVFAQFEAKQMVAQSQDNAAIYAESVATLPKLQTEARLSSAVASEKAIYEHDDLIKSARAAGHTLPAPAPFDPGKATA